MPYIIGTDEAGFGPNLGPLVITATVWRVPEGARCDGLYALLDGLVVDDPRRANADGQPVWTVADSKRVYQPGKGLGGLERGVLTALALLGRSADLWSEVWDALVPDVLPRLARIPWYARYDEPVPIDGAVEQMEMAALAEALLDGLRRAGVELIDVRADAIFPAEWNELIALHDSKGAALSHRSIGLAAAMADGLDGQPLTIACDKHGGRNRYARLLSEYFPDTLIEVHGEATQRSVYRFGPADRRVECCFHARAEAMLPVALASMVSKYLRELAMRAWNAFWLERVPGLRPTAGYPADARRFKKDIATAQAQLGLDDGLLWRCR
jgi:hypothetical protein